MNSDKDKVLIPKWDCKFFRIQLLKEHFLVLAFILFQILTLFLNRFLCLLGFSWAAKSENLHAISYP